MELSPSRTPDVATDSSRGLELPSEQRHYWLTCRTCGASFEDDGVILNCPQEHARGLLAVRYREEHLTVAPNASGIFRYQSWLPIRKPGPSSAQSVVYRSEALGRATGLAELWIAFHGYWPERGAVFETGTFKELEAAAVLARLPEGFDGVLTVASAGNTAAAFARACSERPLSCLLVVPESALGLMRLAGPLGKWVRLVVLSAPADYSDAIDLAGAVSRQPGFQPEGGVFNVARRGGLGTVLFSAVESMGRLPDYYFQAIGSGAGAIAVHEAAERLIAGGEHGTRPPKQILSQNLPFAPIYSAWRLQRQECLPIAQDSARRQIAAMFASVLSSRTPPYGIRGGLWDTLRASQGDVMAVDNERARAASQWFEEREGIDIDPASAVAVASLLEAVREARIDPHAAVLLNITGGGRKRREATVPLAHPLPDVVVRPWELDSPAVMSRIVELFR
jgi:cysteate synthase